MIQAIKVATIRLGRFPVTGRIRVETMCASDLEEEKGSADLKR